MVGLNSTDTFIKPKITVIGVGGAGGNAIDTMIDSKIEGILILFAMYLFPL